MRYLRHPWLHKAPGLGALRAPYRRYTPALYDRGTMNVMTPQPPCLERSRLLEEYANAIAKFAELGRDLSNVAISYEADAFKKAWDRCDKARQVCVELRHMLTQHMMEHGCSFW